MAGIKYGLKKAFYAPITADTESGVTYEVPTSLPFMRQVVINPITQQIDIASDDGIEESIFEAFGAEGTLERSQLSDDEQVALLGYRKLGDTVVGSGEAPYIALGYKRAATGGVTQYVWLLKTKLSESSTTADTKQPSGINPQFSTLNFKSIKRLSDDEWRIFETKTFSTAQDEANFDDTWFSKATLEIAYNLAVKTYGKPTEVIFVTTLPATGVSGKTYVDTSGAKAIAKYWDGAAYQTIATET